MQTLHQVARQCDAEGLYGTAEITLSAGGSAVFDLVAREPARRDCRGPCGRSCAAAATSRTTRASTSASLRQVIARIGARVAGSVRDCSRRSKSGRTSSRGPSPGSRSWRWASATRRSTSTCRCRSRACGTACAAARRELAHHRAQRPARLPAAPGRRRRARRRPRRLRHLASLHDVRQVAMDAERRRRLRRHGRDPDVLLRRDCAVSCGFTAPRRVPSPEAPAARLTSSSDAIIDVPRLLRSRRHRRANRCDRGPHRRAGRRRLRRARRALPRGSVEGLRARCVRGGVRSSPRWVRRVPTGTRRNLRLVASWRSSRPALRTRSWRRTSRATSVSSCATTVPPSRCANTPKDSSSRAGCSRRRHAPRC